MRILYLHQYFGTPTGASATRSYEFAKALVARGHQVTLVCGIGGRARFGDHAPDADGVCRCQIDGIDVIALPIKYSGYQGVFRRAWTFLHYALASIRVALRHDYDLVFATSTPLTAAIPAIIARWLRTKPFIFEVRDLWPELPRAMGMKNPFFLGGLWVLEWLAYRSSRACIGLSPGIVEGIARRSRPNHPISLIPNGSDLDLFHPRLRAPLSIPGINKDDFVAIFPGSHGRANGLDAVLDAALVLKARGDDKIKLLLVGDGSEKSRLQERARAETLDNVIFLDPIPKRELATIVASSDCGLMVLSDIPAFYHGTSPNKFFDFLAAGIPIINNYPGWLAGMITAHGLGKCVPPGDAHAFADALRELADDRESSARMGAASRRLAETDFSRDRLASAFCDWLETHADRPR